ncbi:MAG: HEAT repeat domain-containing protein [Planctomycetota bacterium]
MPASTTTARAIVSRRTQFALLVLALSFLAVGGCASQGKVEDDLETDVNLSDGQQVQNVVSFPFRVAGGAVIYPLKFLFVDMPNGIAGAFQDELHDSREKLKSRDADDRLFAVSMLAESANPAAVPLLVRALVDAEPVIRADAALGLARLGKALVAVGETRGDMPDPLPVEDHLVLRLNDVDVRVRLSVALAIGDLGGDRCIEPLQRVYRNQGISDDNASFYLLARARLGDASARADAHGMLSRVWNPVTISNALLALAHLGGEDSLAELRRALAHPDERVNIAAITGLGIAGEYSMLLTIARDGTLNQQRSAIYALGQYGGRQYVGVIERYRQSAEPRLRVAATLALGSSGWPRAVEPLIGLLRDPDAMTRLQALTQLMKLTRLNLGLEPDSWKRWWNSEGGEFVARNTPDDARLDSDGRGLDPADQPR